MNFNFQETRARLLYRHRMKIVERLAKNCAIPLLKSSLDPADAPDPLVTFCSREFIRVPLGSANSFGKNTSGNPCLGMYFTNLKVGGLSLFLRKPQTASRKLEADFKEACDIYSLPVLGTAFIPALAFELNGDLYVYSGVGRVESDSVLIIRWNKQIRFIYSLPRYLNALEITANPNEQ